MSGRRATLIAGAIVGGTAIMAVALTSGGGPTTATAGPSGTATAAVVRTTLASREQVAGTLARARTYTLVAQQSAGTVTELPTPGAVIDRGQVLYRLDGQPVRLLYGAQSAWRTLARGVTDGTDVLELKRNLKALGFTAEGALAVNDHFDWATAVAIEQWQRAQGVAQNRRHPARVDRVPARSCPRHGAARAAGQSCATGHAGARPQLDGPRGERRAGPVASAARACRRSGSDPTPAGTEHTRPGEPDRRGRQRDRRYRRPRPAPRRRRRRTRRERLPDPGRQVHRQRRCR